MGNFVSRSTPTRDVGTMPNSPESGRIVLQRVVLAEDKRVVQVAQGLYGKRGVSDDMDVAQVQKKIKKGETYAANANPPMEPAPLESNVRFNVGGRLFEVARSTIEQYPNTMLARMIDTAWEQKDYQPGDMFYIDRNGDRFQYVLDYMRDGTVHLPVTECHGAIAHELDYFGFENVEPKKVVQGTLEGGRVMSSISTNLCEQVDALDKKIHGLKKEIETTENQKNVARAAHYFFMRAGNVLEDEQGQFEVSIGDIHEKVPISEAIGKSKGLLQAQLGVYGLKLVGYPEYRLPYSDSFEQFTLERIPAQP